jgi:hypothetical protein
MDQPIKLSLQWRVRVGISPTSLRGLKNRATGNRRPKADVKVNDHRRRIQVPR